MKQSFSLTIPKPCSEDWNSFTPTTTGKFCGSCQKNVIDFTKATDDEIIAFISKKPEHVCGRFRTDQLKSYMLLQEASIRPGFMLLKAGVISLLLLLISKPGQAQTAVLKTKTEIAPQRTTSQGHEILVRGVVTSSEDSTALPGISVVQRGTVRATQTDGYGRFALQVDPSTSDVLVFSFISLKTQEIKISSVEPEIRIVMELDSSSTIGEVVVIAGGLTIHKRELVNGEVYTEQESGLKKFWKKIKSLF